MYVEIVELQWLSSDELAMIAVYPSTPSEIRSNAIAIIMARETAS